MSAPNLKAVVSQVRDRMRVTKIVATRSIKSKNGDFFIAMSSAFDSVQEDTSESDIVSDADVAKSGVTLDEAKVAHLILAHQVNVAAHDAAHAGGGISLKFRDDSVAALSKNFQVRLAETVSKMVKEGGKE
jgi:hypothetical protein